MHFFPSYLYILETNVISYELSHKKYLGVHYRVETDGCPIIFYLMITSFQRIYNYIDLDFPN